jgi:hypothetical protein
VKIVQSVRVEWHYGCRPLQSDMCHSGYCVIGYGPPVTRFSDLGNTEAKDFARRLRKGTGADLTVSGATRLSGTLNYKSKYGPDFPEVKILQAAPGRQTTKAQLESLGLLAAPDPIYDAAASPIRVSSVGNWPDYQRCVLGAPMNHGKTGPDISRADFFWAMMAAQRNHDASAIAAKLMEFSDKAKENGERYAPNHSAKRGRCGRPAAGLKLAANRLF